MFLELIFLSLVIIYAVLCLYRLFISPISRFPGPKLAALSWWYEFYFDVVKHGQFFKETERLHTVYGPIVRINPDEIHINDPDWYNELYTSAARPRDKSSWYIGRGAGDSAFGTVPHNHHRLRRSVLNPFFSKSAVTRLEPLVQEKIDELCELLMQRIGNVIEIRQAYFALNLDIINSYAFGKPIGLLDRSDFGTDWCVMLQKTTEANILLRHLPLLGDILLCLPEWLLARMSAPLRSFLAMQEDMRVQVKETFAREKNDIGTHRTIFEELRDSDLPPEEKRLQRVVDEAVLVVGAGSDTTSQTLAIMTFQLLKTPLVLQRLIAELDANITDPSNVPALHKLEQLPYLASLPLLIILEGHRISSIIVARLIRVAPTEDLRYHEWIIPAGTPISMSTRLIHKDPVIFPEHLEFRPERFLENRDLEKYVIPFSRGSRACLGLNLATAELYRTIATVFRRFEMQLYETTYEDVEFVWDNFFGATRPEARGVRVQILSERP
ncbi:cytochrome P450 [Lojkania enalia]|uniref:Cytochrome P450 n=1 Tax=Lojkania enalia TaxID=147567 RepID=A0A9P4JVK1_9PLEO|nr:cytochrome P450 [Didymosphaeria enalia]